MTDTSGEKQRIPNSERLVTKATERGLPYRHGSAVPFRSCQNRGFVVPLYRQESDFESNQANSPRSRAAEDGVEVKVKSDSLHQSSKGGTAQKGNTGQSSRASDM